MGNDGLAMGSLAFVAGSGFDHALALNNPLGGAEITHWVQLPDSDSIRSLREDSMTASICYTSLDANQSNGRLFGSPGFTFVYNAHSTPYAYGAVSDGTNHYNLGAPLPDNPMSTTDGLFHCQAIVVDREASIIRHHVDGVLTQEASISELGAIDLGNLVVGGTKPHDSYGARMTNVEDLRIWRGALSAVDLQSHYHELIGE